MIGAAFERVSDPSALTTGWHHLAGVRDTTNDRFELWVDGDLVAYKLPTVFGAIDSTAHTVIGQVGPSYNGEYFPSLIDEAEIFNRALSGAEVRAIFDAGTAGKCKTVTVQIDIKPGSDPNSINCSSKGVIPLAILTTDDFDATTVDPTTVALDGVNARIVGKKEQTMCHLEDVDGDGDTDMVCQIATIDYLTVCPSEGFGQVTATTFGGTLITGTDSVRFVPDN